MTYMTSRFPNSGHFKAVGKLIKKWSLEEPWHWFHSWYCAIVCDQPRGPVSFPERVEQGASWEQGWLRLSWILKVMLHKFIIVIRLRCAMLHDNNFCVPIVVENYHMPLHSYRIWGISILPVSCKGLPIVTILYLVFCNPLTMSIPPLRRYARYSCCIFKIHLQPLIIIIYARRPATSLPSALLKI